MSYTPILMGMFPIFTKIVIQSTEQNIVRETYSYIPLKRQVNAMIILLFGVMALVEKMET